jgi:hypothetical protein
MSLVHSNSETNEVSKAGGLQVACVTSRIRRREKSRKGVMIVTEATKDRTQARNSQVGTGSRWGLQGPVLYSNSTNPLA